MAKEIENTSHTRGTPAPQQAYGGAALGLSLKDRTRALPEEQDLLSVYFGMVRDRVVLLAFIVFAFGAVGYFATTFQRRIYQAHTAIEIQSPNENLLNVQNVSPTAPSTGVFSQEYEIQTLMRALKSRSVIDNALSKGDLRKRLSAAQEANHRFHPEWIAGFQAKPMPPDPEQLLVIAYDALKVQAQTNTRVLDLTVDATDPVLAADLANAITDSYVELGMRKRWESMQSVGLWLTNQMQELKAKLEQSEREMQNFAEKSNLLFTSDTDSVADQRLKQLQEELARAQADRVLKQSRFELATNENADSLPEVLDSPTLKEYQLDLTRMRQQLAELNASFTAAYPKTVKLNAQLASLEQARDRERNAITARLRNEFEVSQRREHLLSAAFMAQARDLSAQSAKLAQYNLLKSNVQTTRQLYDLMGQRVREAGLASAMRASNVQVMDRATPPRLPHKPSRMVNTGIGMFFGLLTGMAGVIISGKKSRAMQQPGELCALLNVPELAVIPADGSRFERRMFTRKTTSLRLFSEADSPSLIPSLLNHSPAIEDSFRGAVISIIRRPEARRIRVIVVSSAWPNEGKTTVAANLAAMLAQSNRTVLLVDGDLRRPRLHTIFGADNSRGLSDALKNTGMHPRIQATRIPKLSILTSGSTSASDLLFNSNLPDLFGRLATDFDFVLVDTPPLLQIPDARIVAQASDGVILTVDLKSTTRDDVALADSLLRQDGIPLLGTILNNYKSVKNDRRYSYYSEQHTPFKVQT